MTAQAERATMRHGDRAGGAWDMNEWTSHCERVRLLIGDCRESLKTLPDASVHCCVTSPPYFGLRSYNGGDAEIGTEQTPDAYVAELVAVFREVRRILRDDGVLFLNLGDSYANGLTINPQSCRLRADLTEKEKSHVAMEMFGVRFRKDETAGERTVPEVLSKSNEGKKVCREPGVAGNRVEGQLSTQQGISPCIYEGEAKKAQMGGYHGTGRGVRVLRGDGTGVPDGGSHKRGRGGTPQGAGGIEQSEQCKGLQGYSESGVSEGQVSGSVFQLQLRNRLLGILSTHTFKADEIPDSARFAFAPVVTLKPKDLIGIPSRVAFALQADGWYLRQDIIWHKPNPMPESVTDRCTKAHEYIFLLTKSAKYWYDADAVKEAATTPIGDPREKRTKANGEDAVATKTRGADTQCGTPEPGTRNRHSVWTVATQPFSGAHFATFPPKLIEPCILAGCPGKCCPKCGAGWERVVEKGESMWEQHKANGAPMRKGTSTEGLVEERTMSGARHAAWKREHPDKHIGHRAACSCNEMGCGGSDDPAYYPYDPVQGTTLDPFNGAGTTALVAIRNNRRYIGCELNPEYATLTRERLAPELAQGRLAI